jgi:hypothetical protein
MSDKQTGLHPCGPHQWGVRLSKEKNLHRRMCEQSTAGTNWLGGLKLGACPPGNVFNLGLWNSISCILKTHFKKILSFSKQSFNAEICIKLHAKHSNRTT